MNEQLLLLQLIQAVNKPEPTNWNSILYAVLLIVMIIIIFRHTIGFKCNHYPQIGYQQPFLPRLSYPGSQYYSLRPQYPAIMPNYAFPTPIIEEMP